MDDTPFEIYDVKNSDVFKHMLFSLIHVAKTKTSKNYAWTIAKNSLIDLQTSYIFLEHISICDTINLHDTIDDINVRPEFDSIDPKQIGQAIQSIVDLYRTRMGKQAGYSFLSEFREILGEEYHSIIKKMGVDLRLIDLKKDIAGMYTESYQIKEKRDSNIAFLEKID